MSEEKNTLKPLSKKHQRVLNEYLMCWKQAEAYQKVYKVSWESAKSASSVLFANLNFSEHLRARLDEMQLSADEALKMNSDIARGDLGIFFKVVDEWMFNPLPSYEILDEREVLDDTKEPPEKRVSYRVRHIVLDMDKVTDPKHSHLLREFSDSPRSGLSIKIHDKSQAIERVLRVHGKYKDNLDLTSGGAPLKPPQVIEIVRTVQKDE